MAKANGRGVPDGYIYVVWSLGWSDWQPWTLHGTHLTKTEARAEAIQLRRQDSVKAVRVARYAIV